jgi:ribosome-associated protein
MCSDPPAAAAGGAEWSARLENATSYSFLAASGPGGQNVNKVATACQLRCNVFALGLAPDVYRRLKALAGTRMNAAGEIVITARRFRTQEANREDARARLAELVAKAHVRQQKRRPTRPSRAARAKRVDSKKQRGSIKQGRGRVQLD